MMNKILIASVIMIALSGCSKRLDSEIEQKLLFIEQTSIQQNDELESIKAELQKANLKIDNQTAKIDSLLNYNRLLIDAVNRNHAEDKNILSDIADKITKLFQ